MWWNIASPFRGTKAGDAAYIRMTGGVVAARHFTMLQSLRPQTQIKSNPFSAAVYVAEILGLQNVRVRDFDAHVVRCSRPYCQNDSPAKRVSFEVTQEGTLAGAFLPFQPAAAGIWRPNL